MPSVQWGISTVGGQLQYCGGYSVHWGITSVHAGDNISTVGDSISTVEGIQYSGDTFSTVGDNISTVDVEDVKYYGFSKNLKIFSRVYFASKSDRPHHRPQLLTTANMVKDLGHKNWCWVKYSFEPMTVQAFGNIL